jgi:cell division septal protein FtsQ
MGNVTPTRTPADQPEPARESPQSPSPPRGRTSIRWIVVILLITVALLLGFLWVGLYVATPSESIRAIPTATI